MLSPTGPFVALVRDNAGLVLDQGGDMKVRKLGKGLLWALFPVLLSGPLPAQEKAPPLWGYGIKSCDHYVQAWNGREAGEEGALAEYRRYSDWLSGFASGLNLATGMDVLVGVEIKGALRRIHLYCDEHRKEDFFAATMDLVKLLSQLK